MFTKRINRYQQYRTGRPRFYGPAWYDSYRDEFVYMPIPLNRIAGAIHRIWVWFIMHRTDKLEELLAKERQEAFGNAARQLCEVLDAAIRDEMRRAAADLIRQLIEECRNLRVEEP